MSETTSGRSDPGAGEADDLAAPEPAPSLDEPEEGAEEIGDLEEEAEETAGDTATIGAAEDSTLSPTPPPTSDETVAAPKNRSARTIRAGDAARTAAATEARRGKGRTTPKGGTPVRATSRTGRYTHPIPRERRQSPPWYPFVLLAFLILGLLTIVLNYVNVLPGGTNNWYLIGGILAIVVGLFMATFYH